MMPIILPVASFLEKMETSHYKSLIQQSARDTCDVIRRGIQWAHWDSLPDCPVPVQLGALITLVVCPLLLCAFIIRTRRKAITTSVDALTQELACVIVPATSFWPVYWSKLVISSTQSNCLRLDPDMLRHDVLMGLITLRSSFHLAALLRGPLVLRACTIMLDVKIERQLNILARLRLWQFGSILINSGYRKRVDQEASDHSDSRRTFDLDVFTRIPTPTIFREQGSGMTDPLVLQFTTHDPSVSSYELDTASVISTLPFLPRQQVNKQDLRRLQHFRAPGSPPIPVPHHLERASGARLLERRLPVMMHALLLAHPQSRVVSLRDVSSKHADRLDALTRGLTEDKTTRMYFASHWGEEGRAEEIFYLTWEAALFRAGILLRYEIVLAAHG